LNSAKASNKLVGISLIVRTDTLTRSKRRTVALYVRDGVVEVRAPLKMPKSAIDKFVVSKQKWISDKLAQSAKRVNLRENFSLTYGDSATYRGKQYEIAESSRIGVSDNCFFVRADLTPEQIKADCVKIYKILAQSDLNEKVRDLSCEFDNFRTQFLNANRYLQNVFCRVRDKHFCKIVFG